MANHWLIIGENKGENKGENMEESKRFTKYDDSIVKGLTQGSKNTFTVEFDQGEVKNFMENFVKEEFGVSLEELKSLLKQLEEKQKRLIKGTH